MRERGGGGRERERVCVPEVVILLNVCQGWIKNFAKSSTSGFSIGHLIGSRH